MGSLPITHVKLYKHGVGFFRRHGTVEGEEAKLSFRSEDVNDVLKSLTVFDEGGGRILGVDYATPKTTEERLARCTVRLGDTASLRDLLKGSRGRAVRLSLDGGKAQAGTLVGIDDATDGGPLETSLVSVLLEDTAKVQVVRLGSVRGVEILDEQGAADLRFFLETSLDREDSRHVTVRLTPGSHKLNLSYIAPAPTWRVSYRLVLDDASTVVPKGGRDDALKDVMDTSKSGTKVGPKAGPKGDSRGSSEDPKALLLGWGIFDNSLEEDLEGVSLSLVAGMPVSFVYDLSTSFTPERPVVHEEGRVAAGPIGMEAAQGLAGAAMMPDEEMAREEAVVEAYAPMEMSARGMAALSGDALRDAAPVAAEGKAHDELFEYAVSTPVTVGRGQSAMVPIVSSDLGCKKDLIYNGAKLPDHPMATLRLQNDSGLTLERGPVTVLGAGEYLGEAVLPFTTAGGEIVVPYAVELGVKVSEDTGSRSELHHIYVRNAYFNIEEWLISWREYTVSNKTAGRVKVLVEHSPTYEAELFETPDPAEKTDEHLRFEVQVPARGEKKLRVQERRLISRREEIRRQSYETLQRYLRAGLIDKGTHDSVRELLRLMEKIERTNENLGEIAREREKIHAAQKQIQGNMKALGTSGKEGELRAGYVAKLEATEKNLKALEENETGFKEQLASHEADLDRRLLELR
jgi:hypothetical protein